MVTVAIVPPSWQAASLALAHMQDSAHQNTKTVPVKTHHLLFICHHDIALTGAAETTAGAAASGAATSDGTGSCTATAGAAPTPTAAAAPEVTSMASRSR